MNCHEIPMKISQEIGHISIWNDFVLCIWIIDLTFGELKSLQIRQSGEYDIELSANPAMYLVSMYIISSGQFKRSILTLYQYSIILFPRIKS